MKHGGDARRRGAAARGGVRPCRCARGLAAAVALLAGAVLPQAAGAAGAQDAPDIYTRHCVACHARMTLSLIHI